MLDKLPVEILDMIFGQVKNHRDLKHLTEVCSRLHSCAIPRLYQSVVLSTTEISLGELATTVEAIPRKYSIYTQELGLSIPIHKRVVSLCVHLNGDDRDISEVPTEEDDIFYEWTDHEDTNDEHPGEESPESGDADPFLRLVESLDSLLLHDDQLRSFRWELGTCIPKDLLSGDELSFLRNQKKLESIPSSLMASAVQA